jgi:hypothetical protein
MAAPFTDTAKIGVDLNGVTTAADLAAGKAGDARLGSQVFTSDGGIAVYVQAGDTIAANVTVADVDDTTFVAAATGGAYRTPNVAVAIGDRFWARKASV